MLSPLMTFEFFLHFDHEHEKGTNNDYYCSQPLFIFSCYVSLMFIIENNTTSVRGKFPAKFLLIPCHTCA